MNINVIAEIQDDKLVLAYTLYYGTGFIERKSDREKVPCRFCLKIEFMHMREAHLSCPYTRHRNQLYDQKESFGCYPVDHYIR